jgi:hypothetical protein
VRLPLVALPALVALLALTLTPGAAIAVTPTTSDATPTTPAAGGAIELDWERDISPNTGSQPFPFDRAFDPIVATHPTDPDRIAVVYHRYRTGSGSCTTLSTGLRVTDDGGAHWHEGAGLPWAGSGRAPNWHATLAWGPGPRPGHARLYWADTTVPTCAYDAHRLSVAWSDDEGDTWSRLWVDRSVASTPQGGYPDITVDTDPGSPDYGVVYATINWFPDAATEPHLRVVASRDFGVTWTGAEVPPLRAPRGYPFAYRIGYRLTTAPDGSLFVTFHQSDTTDADRSRYGRDAFGIARLRYDRTDGTFWVGAPRLLRSLSLNSATLGGIAAPGSTDTLRLRPRWTHGVDVDPATGRLYVAIADYVLGAPSKRARGKVFVGHSDDSGQTWAWSTVPALPLVDGRRQSAHKPTLVAGDGFVFVGLHGLVDLPLGTDPTRGLATIGNLWSISTDGGVTFSRPRPISAARWDLEALARAPNRAGLRDRAALTADGRVVYVYGDGRKARPAPDPSEGHSTIELARFSPV